MTLTSFSGKIETWRLNHFDEETGWTGPDLEDIYDDMMNLRESFTLEEMSDKKIMERFLGRHSVYLRGWGRSDDNPGARASTKPNQPGYQELLQKYNDVSTHLDEFFSILRQNNIMPLASGTSEASDTDTNLDNSE
ncbi:hypothetical protein POM88_009329 [Heracleum sosnowskyi]|uniref:Uncharacterized protein n=1 Tax=Heracleum sosnowskyi TaxID=360622 RepID=A0AAD8N887_9APIA|nr:hypothetical protein POM88_009329 [Heracleum sosnowskyi]